MVERNDEAVSRAGSEGPEPAWLRAMRGAARQRPRTRFVKIAWMDLHPLLRERDALWNAAPAETRAMVLAMRDTDDYAYQWPSR